MLNVTVKDKNGKVLSPEELSSKIIDIPEYYAAVIPQRKALNKKLSTK